MGNEKVLVVIITKDNIHPLCHSWVLNQDYKDFRVMTCISKPAFSHENKNVEKYVNCSENRNYARQMALASDCDYFLFVDSDIGLPPNAISQLMSHKKDIIGGWYKMKEGANWVAGKWLSDQVFFNFKKPENSVIKVDVIGMGCALFSRKALSEIKFEDGVSNQCMDEYGYEIMFGECGMAGHRAQLLGYSLYMDGDVICAHF